MTFRITGLRQPATLSAITRIELENGVWREPLYAKMKQDALDLLLGQFAILAFRAEEIAAYREILKHARFSKRKTSDRMTAATAITQGLTLVTMNGRDFRDVPGLAACVGSA